MLTRGTEEKIAIVVREYKNEYNELPDGMYISTADLDVLSKARHFDKSKDGDLLLPCRLGPKNFTLLMVLPDKDIQIGEFNTFFQNITGGAQLIATIGKDGETEIIDILPEVAKPTLVNPKVIIY